VIDNITTKMPTWMINMIALDIVHDDGNDDGEVITTNTTNTANVIKCSLPDLRCKVEM